MNNFREMALNEEQEVNYLTHTLYIVAQMQIYHWVTNNSNDHDATFDYYKELQDKIDVFAETLITKYEIEYSIESFELVFDLDKNELLEIIEEYDELTNDVISEFTDGEDSSLINTLEDIKLLNDQLRFKLSLK